MIMWKMRSGQEFGLDILIIKAETEGGQGRMLAVMCVGCTTVGLFCVFIRNVFI